MKGEPQTGFSADTFDPANVEGDIGFFRALFRIHDVAQERALPCIVRRYDAETGRASVEPLVKNMVRNVDGWEERPRPVYEDIPVMRLCRGGFSVDFPLSEGDIGILLALDRNCADAIKDNSGEVDLDGSHDNKGPKAPGDMSLASFANGVFIPFSFSKPSGDDGIVVRGIGEGAPTVRITKSGVSVESNGARVSVDADGVHARRGEDEVSLTDNGPVYKGPIDEKVRFLTKLKYDMPTHRLMTCGVECGKRGTFIVSVGKESGWGMIEGGQAEPVSTEQQ